MKKIIFILFTVLTFFVNAQNISVPTPPDQYFLTTAERSPSVAITNGTTYTNQVVYSIKLPSLVPANSVIAITSHFEVTNNYAYNLGVGRFIKIGTTPTDSSFMFAGGLNTYPYNPVEDNCTPANHHWVVNMNTDYFVNSNITNGYLNVVTYGVTATPGGGDAMKIEVGYGNLTCTIKSAVNYTGNDPVVDDWLSFLTTAPSATYIAALNTLIRGIKADNNWLFDKFYIHATEQQQHATISLVNPGINKAVEVGGITWTARRGYTSAATKYLNLNYTPSTDTYYFQKDNACMGLYSTTNSQDANADMGSVGAGGANGAFVYARYTDDKIYGSLNDNGGVLANVSNTISSGCISIKRTSSTNVSYWRNGVQLGTKTESSSGLGTKSIYLGTYNNNGVAATGTTRQYAISFIGSGSIDMAKLNTRLQAFAMAIGF